MVAAHGWLVQAEFHWGPGFFHGSCIVWRSGEELMNLAPLSLFFRWALVCKLLTALQCLLLDLDYDLGPSDRSKLPVLMKKKNLHPRRDLIKEELGIEYDEDVGVNLQAFPELLQHGKKRARVRSKLLLVDPSE
ncbi:hypothetical protein V6N11_051979 [Hibiscus sabdariffa]|uniref:Uncharacterized protein n=1 Tax=Hibiscus sabdariffa TaxID=183260 RepID=A0ABR2U8Z0_9ROSI